MDFEQILGQLHGERELLSEAIKTLEEMAALSGNSGKAPAKRRGRKSMPPHEREEVSRRMKKYWAARRKK